MNAKTSEGLCGGVGASLKSWEFEARCRSMALRGAIFVIDLNTICERLPRTPYRGLWGCVWPRVP